MFSCCSLRIWKLFSRINRLIPHRNQKAAKTGPKACKYSIKRFLGAQWSFWYLIHLCWAPFNTRLHWFWNALELSSPLLRPEVLCHMDISSPQLIFSTKPFNANSTIYIVSIRFCTSRVLCPSLCYAAFYTEPYFTLGWALNRIYAIQKPGPKWLYRELEHIYCERSLPLLYRRAPLDRKALDRKYCWRGKANYGDKKCQLWYEARFTRTEW